MEYRDILFMVLAALVALFGAPIIQLIKNLLSKLFRVVIEDRWAIVVTFGVSILLALIEMWLTGQFANLVITPATFPAFFAGVYSIAQVYFSWFKNSDSVLGARALLKPPEG